jgi:branched-chain amino acid aminotransferase
MIDAMDIPVTRTKRSKLPSLDLSNLPFGRHFSDHILEADFFGGEWKNVQIRPYQSLSLEPSTVGLHYGQSIFEGIKAYKSQDGQAFIFRPLDNFRRFNISAERMEMPTIPEDIFIEGMRRLVDVDRDWIPAKEDHSLYIRPLMFASDTVLGVRPAENYKFLIMLSPTGPYYASPMRIYVEEQYTRASPGGVGFAKNAGNYGAAMKATARARERGYDQVLWTDAFEHKWLQEIGTMNAFFVVGKKVLTPSLDEGTILEGVTRDSAIQVIREMGLEIEERRIHIEEILEAHRQGQLAEVFGTGTAATISPIKELGYRDKTILFDLANWEIAPALKKTLQGIREGRIPDKFGWLFRV